MTASPAPRNRSRVQVVGLIALIVLHAPLVTVSAQGVTTAAIRGVVTSENGQPVAARVRIRNDAAGTSIEAGATRGRFVVHGLEPGGPYTVTAIAIGYTPERRDSVYLSLGELRVVNLVMQATPQQLAAVTVADRVADPGTGTTVLQTLIEQLPTLNRDFYDFVRLVPQISTRISVPNPGFSAGGMGFRFNNYLINGLSERTLSGSASNSFAGIRSISLDAVREYQVLVAPYDVRYGDFGGAMVNTITKSGTNTLGGTAFVYGRTDELSRASESSVASYERAQVGFALGGPLVRDRLHFFVAPEWQHYTYPAEGPFVGQPADAARALPVDVADIDRFASLLGGYGLAPGSAGAVQNGTPLRNYFGRLDLALPEWRSRLILWNNQSGLDDLAFSRAAADTFALSSYRVTRGSSVRVTAAHLHTDVTGGAHNELLVSQRTERLHSRSPVLQPDVRVVVPSAIRGSTILVAGTPGVAQNPPIISSAIALKDHFTRSLGDRHVAVLGAEVERFRLQRGGLAGSLGTWSFASLDDLAAGRAEAFEVALDFGTSTPVLNGAQYAAYVSTNWQARNNLSFTGGIRADLLALFGHAPYHAGVDSLVGLRTDQNPPRRVELSPRLGFQWDINDTGRDRIRGGVGVFTTRYPLAWAQSARASYGVAGGVLRCSRSSTADRVPPTFDPRVDSRPTACGGGYTLTASSRGDVDMLAADLRMLRVARSSFAYERRLPGNMLLTNEALASRSISDFVFVNLNLVEPRGADSYGRVIYGTHTANGGVIGSQRSTFSEVFEIQNTSKNHAYQLSSRLETSFANGTGGFASYTYSRVRDVQTPIRVNMRGLVTWASARATGGRHDDFTATISANDIPHRVVIGGSLAGPSRRTNFGLSFYYVGEAGRPFTYLTTGASGRGDLNADGSNANDPVYVPRNALDPNEILLTGISEAAGADNSAEAQAERELLQRSALESFVQRTDCLRRQRGQILARNSCREPWSHTTILSLRQAFPIGTRRIEAQFDVFNVLNLLNQRWGVRREATTTLLTHVGQSGSPALETSRPIFRFSSAPQWIPRAVDSAYQLQLALRYRF